MSTDNKQNLPAIAPLRLPYHPSLREKYGIDAGQWRVLTDAIFPAAQTIEAVIMAIAYCANRKLDIFKHQCHIVPIWSEDRGCYIETVWPSISEIRTTAMRTKEYAGCDATIFGPDIDYTWGSGPQAVTVRFPEWAQVTVYRLVGGQRCPFPGPQVYWLETYAHIKGGVPNKMWRKRARGQIEKCAEAAALRKAFAEEVGGELSSDEAEGITIDTRQHFPVPVDAPAPRISKVEQMAAQFKEPPPQADVFQDSGQSEAADPLAEQFTEEQWGNAIRALQSVEACREFVAEIQPDLADSPIRDKILRTIAEREEILTRQTR